MTNKENPQLSEKFIPIVLCAGFGTRLKPITNYIPKVICPIIDKPLSFFSIENFFKHGFENVFCNTHYMPDAVENELKRCAENFGYNPNRIVFFNEENILGSGGGILNIVQKLREHDPQNTTKDVIVSSGDVVANFPLKQMIERWEQRTENELALMLSLPLTEQRDDAMWISQNGAQVVGFGKAPDLSAIARLFSNHQIIASQIFDDCTLKSDSSVDMFYKKILSKPNQQIIHDFYPESSYWFNVGDIDEYKKCLKYFCAAKQLTYPIQNKMHSQNADISKKIYDLLLLT